MKNTFLNDSSRSSFTSFSYSLFILFTFSLNSYNSTWAQSSKKKIAKPSKQENKISQKEDKIVNKEKNELQKEENISNKEDVEFRKKLTLMSEKTDKSIKLIREQIVQNQSAPFLADLYLQLADLLSQKSNILYYQQMEKEKGSDLKLTSASKANPIVITQKEAITIYQQILKEFPNFEKRDKVLYRLALSQKSIDETPAFIATSEKLINDFPSNKETMQVRLLLGQHYFDQHDFKQSLSVLNPVKSSKFPYERNAARYRTGLIMMSEEKFKEALDYFEKVSTDDELKEEDNPIEVSLQTRATKSSIKREALIDSVRAYTEVYKKDADPVAFYSRIAPTEALFQEVIEKLAYRYIFLKKESHAMKLLRVLSERVADPQKIVNIYQEVLLMIPMMDRIEVPFQEMQFVLSKYNTWLNYFEIPQKTKEESHKFFETQLREMGTKSHDLGKSEFSKARKDLLFERARNFYHLYLGFFEKSPDSVKIATNLADVYYYQQKYLESGDYYLRVFLGEFGPPTNKEQLIQNAILCFQKKAPNDYYELTRMKGLLVKALQSYMIFKPKEKKNPKTNFVLAKTYFEQGLYNKALNDLHKFVSTYPNSKTEVEASVDLILDYFNTRSDFNGLVTWSQKLLAIQQLPKDLKTRLQGVKSKALLKKLDEEVKSKKGFDPFSQGKIYFETALSMQDESLRSAALEQALARSKSEKDINTFLKTAKVIALKEKQPQKRATILLAMADETLNIGRYYQTFDLWLEGYNSNSFNAETKKQIFEKMVRLSIMLKDWSKLHSFMSAKSWTHISGTLKQSVAQQISEHAESPQKPFNSLLEDIPYSSLSENELLPFYKGQFKLSAKIQNQILHSSQTKCKEQKSDPLCKWLHAKSIHNLSESFKKMVAKSPPKIQSVEPIALKFNGLLKNFKILEESGDPVLDIFSSLNLGNTYLSFSQFLHKTASMNKEVAGVLEAKASESMIEGKKELTRCEKIINMTGLISPINKYCKEGKAPSHEQALSWRKILHITSHKSDPHSKEIDELQRKLFVDHSKPESFLDLGYLYLQKKYFNHAVALGTYGMSTFSQDKDDFAAILGCALSEMGLLNEAYFHLKGASDFKNIKTTCINNIKALALRL